MFKCKSHLFKVCFTTHVTDKTEWFVLLLTLKWFEAKFDPCKCSLRVLKWFEAKLILVNAA